jgi:DNA polymerase III subunit epsilon
MFVFKNPLCFVDVETTGTSPTRDRIIEVGVVRVEDGKVVQEFSSLVNPKTHLPPMITQLTGIDSLSLIRAPLFEEVSLNVREMLDGAMFVAHNVRFDYAFLKHEFKRLGIEYSANTMDTVKLSRVLYPKFRKHDLSSIIQRHNLEVQNRHRAFDDAKALWGFICESTKSLGTEKISETIAYLCKNRLQSTLLNMDNKSLPEKPGVYIFYGKNKEILYIGKSKNLRERVLSHFYNDYLSQKEMEMTRQTADIKTITTPGELSALILESQMIKDEMPIFNRMLRRKKEFVVAIQTVTPEGYKTLVLDTLSEIETHENIVGIYKSKRKAKETMYEIAKEHRLCPKLMGIEKGKGACFYSQLGNCDGACTGIEDTDTYNAKFGSAFERTKIRQWPYEGTIMIKEEDEEGNGIALFVDHWKLLATVHYGSEGATETVENSGFDIDTYKILVRVLLDTPKNCRIEKVSSTAIPVTANDSMANF